MVVILCLLRYVLKPQREGGGNNVYGEDIRPFLQVSQRDLLVTLTSHSLGHQG